MSGDGSGPHPLDNAAAAKPAARRRGARRPEGRAGGVANQTDKTSDR